MSDRHYSLHGLVLESQVPFPEVRRSRARQPSAVIELTDGPLDRSVRWFHRWSVALGPPSRHRHTWLSFGRHNDGYVLRFRDLGDFEVSLQGHRIRSRPAPGLPGPTLRHVLLDQVLPLALSQTGRLVLHASAVHVPRFGAIALVGRAGAGKSTLAAALASCGAQLLSDDALVVSATGDRLLAVPAYPGVRLWTTSARGLLFAGSTTAAVAHYTRKRRVASSSLPFRTTPSRLRAVLVLSRRRKAGLASHTRQLPARDRLIALIRHTYVIDPRDRRLLSRSFSALTSLVTEIPVVELSVRNDARALRRAAAEVLALARRAVDS